MNLLETQTTGFAFGLFCGMLVMLELGRRVGARQRARLTEGGAAGVGAVAAAVFALLGLIRVDSFDQVLLDLRQSMK
jgi:acyl-CoA synthetase (NDP forming)